MSNDSIRPKPPLSFPSSPSRASSGDFSVPRIREVVVGHRSGSSSSAPPWRSSPRPAPAPRPQRPSSRVPAPWTKRPPRPQVTREQVMQLAQHERVPVEVARAELEGGLPSRQWREQNPAEAARFDRVFALMASTPGMTIDTAVTLEQRGVSVESLAAHRAEREATKRILKARGAVPNTGIEAFRNKLVDGKTDLVVVLDRKVVTDKLVQIDRLSLAFAEQGAVPALDILVLARRQAWLAIVPQIRFDDQLAANPAPVEPELTRRPAADPTPFVALVGKKVKLTLRNGMMLHLKLNEAGPFDLVLGEGTKQVLVSLHAIASWEAGA